MCAPPSTPIRSDLPDGIDLALCRSALWEALALGVRPPTLETVTRLTSEDSVRALADAAAVLDATDDRQLEASVLRLARAPAPSLPQLAEAHDRHFGHTARGRVPPYETEYGEDSTFAPQRDMSDLSAFYRAFGLALRPDAHERPDHLACECEFMVLLARKEAHALGCGDTEMLAVTRGAVRLFLRDHLGRWAPALGRKLAREDAGGFYGALGALCVVFVTAECRRSDTAAGPDFLRLRSTESIEAPMACGVPGEVPGVP
jgi:TorA maturation chaperone TorD